MAAAGGRLASLDFHFLEQLSDVGSREIRYGSPAEP
jgi:hypothetical protein